MKYRFIFIFLFVISVLFFGVLSIALFVLSKNNEEYKYIYPGDNGYLEMNTWYDVDSCKYYVFIPSFVDFNQLVLQSNSSFLYKNTKNGVINKIGNCIEDVTYELIDVKNNKKTNQQICFKKLSSIPALFLETKSGSLKKIHNNKEYKEDISIRIIDANGNDVLVNEKGKIKGRGASTWEQPKKSYLITTIDSLDIFGMGLANKWVLLSNSYDESNLRNKIAYDFAKKIGLETSPDCEYVDLFINGDYLGLYLLSEKVEFGPNRINVTENPKYLFTLTSERQSSGYNVLFKEESGVRVALEYPKAIPDNNYQFLQQLLASLDSSIVYNTKSQYFDIDSASWALVYLVDELFANSDANFISSYLYCSGDCSKVFRGPVWDYDQSIGNNLYNMNPETFLAGKRNVSYSIPTPYNYCLMNDNDFNSLVRTYFKEKVNPMARQLIDNDLDVYEETIHLSKNSNSLRWHRMFKDIESLYWRNPSQSVQSIKEYLQVRLNFLNSAWIKEVPYHIVLIETIKGNDYLVLSIEDSMSISDSLLNRGIYKERETDRIFKNTPITSDCELILCEDSKVSHNGFVYSLGIGKGLAFALLCLFVAGVIILYLEYSGRI